MSARILVIDDDPTNVILISSYLRSHYYIVDGAVNTKEALEKMADTKPHLIILDAVMPNENGFDFASRIKIDPQYWDIPIIMVTALEAQDYKRQALVCGIDDFLIKPVDPKCLSVRVKSLLNQKMSIDIIRNISLKESNFSSQLAPSLYPSERASIALLGKDYSLIDAFKFSGKHIFDFFDTKESFYYNISKNSYDLAIVDFSSFSYEPCQFCAHYMVSDHGRNIPLMVLCDERNKKTETVLLKQLLDIGVSDAFSKNIGPAETELRIATQIRYKRYFEMLLCNFNESARMASTDALTGIYNRYYFVNSINRSIEDAKQNNENLSLALFDIDHFKNINDTYGHIVGDEVLKVFVERILDNLEVKNVFCRYGGEEFALVMPNTSMRKGQTIINNILSQFKTNGVNCLERDLKVTFSAGISELSETDTSFYSLIERADKALYKAKKSGRQCVRVYYSDEPDNVIPFPIRAIC